MRITRTAVHRYSVTTSTVMSDGSYRADSNMKLVGHELVSAEVKGDIRIGGTLRVKLGPVSYQRVNELGLNESIEL